MVSEEETKSIRRFVCGELRDGPDLSSLTVGILKKRYLAWVGRESLSPEAKTYMKQVVAEELMKMQHNDSDGGELETKRPQNKRKREKEDDEVLNDREDEDESRAKKCRNQSGSSSESEDEEGRKTGSEESEEEDQMKSGSEDEEEEEVEKSQQKTNGNRKQQIISEESSDEEMNESVKKGNESNCGDSPKEMTRKEGHTTKNGETRSSSASPGKKTPQSGKENETDNTGSESERSDKVNGNESSDDSEKEEKALVEKKNNNPDSDSSSLPSLDNDQESETENKQDNKKKKTVEKGKSSKSQKVDNKTVVRLKRFIALCGVKKNYKKLLGDCRSIRSMVAVLRKELEDLGVEGNPTIKKCKKIRMQREEAQELADLDVSNILATKGRPTRGAALRQEQHDPPSPTYQRTLNSGSDSDQENTHKKRRRPSDWANLQGIISDDADSD
ncbi:HIRA-interacting protein 3 isoform X2 [Lates calcarifer]|uniref:HIRA-interacting protein 3 isoform X2 n=1 Tax=Lates calcarifer TaxID=8187 RepID=A0AAJ7PK23_LATCA|nr:HIRA-interacting protein 3 isoform X2 [Lates calcarifer]